MPRPSPGETQRHFVARCMKYPDLQRKPLKERLGECYGLWREGHKCCEKTYRLKSMGIETFDYDGGLAVDESKMCATGVLSTTARDREGDIIETAGIDTTFHRLNPVALLDHGLRYALPVGKTADPDTGEYAVVVGANSCVQTTYFSQHSDVAEQVFRLIAEKTLVGNSIGYRPVEVRRLPADPENGHRGGNHILRCELLEVTWTALPANQECVTALLDQGTIGGKAIAPAVKSLLLPYRLPKKVWAPGAEISEGKEIDTGMSKEYMSAVDQSQGGSLVGDKAADAEAEVSHEEGGDLDIPHGAKVCKDLHEGLSYLKGLLEEQQPRLEHPEVKKLVGKLMGKIDEHLGHVAETHNKNYPDLDPLEEGHKAEEPEAHRDEEQAVPEEGHDDLDEEGERKALKLLGSLSAKVATIEKKYHTLVGR